MNFKNILLLSFILFLAGCGGGSGTTASTVTTSTITSQELTDPNAAASNLFGFMTTILANSNIVIVSPQDDSGSSNAGAVHLYNPYTKTRIASIYGDNINDYLGRGDSYNRPPIALSNNNFVIASASDDVSGISNAGSVMLINGSTGAQIGTTLSGNTANDYFGDSGITALSNNNFVIASSRDDVSGISDAGSVMLINGATGAQIGTTLAGDSANDSL